MRRNGIIALFIIVIFGIYWFSGESETQEQEPQMVDEADDADVSMSGVEMRLGQEGRTLWTLNAMSASYDQGQQVVRLQHPIITKNLADNEQPVIVTAPLGEVDQASNDIRLWSGVHVEYGPTYLNADQAIFVQVDDTIYLSEDILLDRQGMQLRSTKGDVDLTTWVVNAEGGVEVLIVKNSFTQGF